MTWTWDVFLTIKEGSGFLGHEISGNSAGDLFGIFKWPFRWLSGLQLVGDKRTWYLITCKMLSISSGARFLQT